MESCSCGCTSFGGMASAAATVVDWVGAGVTVDQAREEDASRAIATVRRLSLMRMREGFLGGSWDGVTIYIISIGQAGGGVRAPCGAYNSSPIPRKCRTSFACDP